MKTGKSKDHLQRVFLRFLYLIMGSILSLDSVMAQENLKISGQVTDNKGEAIIGASVKVLKTGTGTISDMDGKFTIQVPVGAELEIGYVGYNPKRVKVVNKNFVTVVLEENVVALGDVVVVGYGIQKKESLTGAIGNLKVDDIVKTKAPSLAQAIQGKVAGLRIRQENGEPGKFSSNINVRGFGTPLFVIDGVVRDGSSEFQRLNPEDIESISFLKDATASIYGMNSANGAVIVTTKKGATGKPRITLNANVGITSPTNVPEMANARQYMTMRNEAEINAGRPAYITKDELTKWQQGAPGYESVDLYDAVFNKHATQFQTTLSLEGGTDKVSYYGSFGYATDNSLLKNNALTYDKYTFRSNVSLKITKDLTASINLGGRYDTTNRPWFPFYDIFKSTRVNPPTTSIYANDNPDYYNNFSYVPNPAAMIDADYTGSAKERNKNLQTQFALEYNIPYVKGLKVKGTFIYDYNNYGYKATRKGFKTYTYGEYTGEYTAADANYPALLQDNRRESERVDMQFQTNYNRTFGNHTIGATYVFERREEKANWMNGERKFDFFTIGELDNARESDQKVSGSSEHQAYLSHIGRLTYDYNSRYLAEFNIGYNGSENFAPDKRFGTFPAGSIGYVLSEEPFWKRNSYLTYVKLRASVGLVGNDNMSNNRFLYLPDSYLVNKLDKDNGYKDYLDGYNFGLGNTVIEKGADESRLGNSNVTWETALKQNYGIDVNFFNDKLRLTFDYFVEKRKDILINRSTIPIYTSLSSSILPVVNMGKVDNKGYEISLKWNDRVKNFSYWLDANMSYAKNKIIYQDEVEPNEPYMWRTGQSVGSIFGYVTDRFYTEEDFDEKGELVAGLPKPAGIVHPGDLKYKDLNGDNIINSDDVCKIGNSKRPLYTFGLNYGFEYKGFFASMNWTAAKDANVSLQYSFQAPFEKNHVLYQFIADGSWTKETAGTAKYPRLSSNPSNTESSTTWVQDASYIKLKNATIGYNITNKRLLKAIGASLISIKITGYNLLTFDKLEFMDPEGEPNRAQSYPIMKIYNLGVNVTF